jgi:NADH:ubiquinone oxidoreductase subunit 5 (subunit L)/multisubunit Na+/H+ antiporter MnhA subunit
MKWLIALVGCFLFVGLVLTTGFWLPAPAPQKLLSYDQFISISLTAITVVLAVIALLMAYLAFEGKNQIVDKAREVAKQEFDRLKPQLIQDLKSHASEQVTSYLSQQNDAYNQDLATAPTGNIDVPNDVTELKNV